MGSMKDLLGDQPFEETQHRPSDAERYGAAKQARDEGMARVDNSADSEWKRIMSEMVTKTAREMRRFTTDDVFDRFDLIQNRPVTHDKRAMGPVMLRASKLGICQKAPVPAVMSKRRTLHASPIQVWDSLIYSGGQS